MINKIIVFLDSMKPPESIRTNRLLLIYWRNSDAEKLKLCDERKRFEIEICLSEERVLQRDVSLFTGDANGGYIEY